MKELSEEELQAMRVMLRRSIAENEYNIERLEKYWTDHVALYKQNDYMDRLRLRDTLASITSKYAEAHAELNFRNKVEQN